jgi:inner membrane protein
MDIGTHALASLALTRAILPRAPRVLWGWTIAAGVIADGDSLSALAGPAVYLAWYRTYTHSLLAVLVIAAEGAAMYRLFAPVDSRARLSSGAVFAAMLLAGLLHVAMDATQWQGVELLWPFKDARIAADWLPTIDPWILAILIAAMVLPELLHLVSSEIGAKNKKRRGFAPAITALVLLMLYTGLRAELHATAVAQLQNRAYAGESPRQAGAFSDFTSLVTWHGIAETESALHEVVVHIGATRQAALDPGVNLYKPEPSPLLQEAQGTEVAKRFLRVARFPEATVEKMDAGSEVQIRDLRYAAAGETKREPIVAIDFDAAGKIMSEEIRWANRETPR